MQWEREAIEDNSGKVMWIWRCGPYTVSQSIAELEDGTWNHVRWRWEATVISRGSEERIGASEGYLTIDGAKAAARAHAKGELVDSAATVRL